MGEQRQDRRVRRTRKLLKDSLISLMQEKEFKNISVKDITSRADLNRGTFYLHYSDIYQLLQEMEEELLVDFQNMIDTYYHIEERRGSLLGVMIPIVNYIAENKAVCQMMFENNASSEFLNRFHHLIHQNGRPILKILFPDAEENRYDLFFEFATYGTIGMLRQWLNSNQSIPKETLAEMVDKAVLGTAERLLL